MIKKQITGLTSILKNRILKRKTPFSVNLHLTDRCNYNCKYCNIWSRNREEMSTEQIFSLIDNLSKLGCQRIGFTGGEPLLRKDIGQIIDYTKKKGIFSSMVSNCSLFKNKIYELKNLDVLATNLQGPKEVQDKQIREGSYDKVIEAIKLARENNIIVWNVIVLTKYNIDYIDFMLNLAEELDFYLHVQPALHYSFSGEGVVSMLPEPEKYRNVIKKLIEQKNKRLNKRGEKIINSSISCLKYFENYPKYKKLKCFAGELFYYIDINGDLLPCVFMQGRIKAPNIFEVGLKKAMYETKRLPCDGCWCHANIELNRIFSLNPKVMLNLMENIKKK